MKETQLNGESLNIVSDNIEKMKQLFPEIITEDKIDFNKLKEILGKNIEESDERYNLTWPGKTEALRESQKPSTGTLNPCKEDSKNWDSTQNLYIEGDNLEVLKILQKSYYNKVKMIYIDPPYNTGNDFVYYDNYKDNLENYLEITGQLLNDNGRKIRLSNNSSAIGRFHTNWLNMIYPRLKLSRNLLSDDGVIFISIDDHEHTNLKKICDEIFGEDNFIGEIIRKTKSMTGDNGNGFNIQHENLIVYGRVKSDVFLHGAEKEFKNYSNPDNDLNGDWCSGDPSAKSGGETTYFPIENPMTGQKDYPPKGRYWAFSKNSLKKYIENGKIKFKEEYKSTERGFIFKRYKKDTKNIYNPLNSLFAVENEFMNQNGTNDLQTLLNGSYFPYPKPVNFIKNLVKSNTTSSNDIILDFFSGSGTTAVSIMQKNYEDKDHCKFIMVQLPELTDEKSEAYKAGFKNICEIGKERIRRAGDNILEESKDKNLDVGFKVFKLDSSNLTKWNPDYDNLEYSLISSADNIISGRSKLDLVYEIMLKYGLDLTVPINQKEIEGKTVYNVGFGALFICLDDNLTVSIADELVDLIKDSDSNVTRVVFKNNGFASDSDKVNVKETLRVNNVNEFITI